MVSTKLNFVSAVKKGDGARGGGGLMSGIEWFEQLRFFNTAVIVTFVDCRNCLYIALPAN